MQNGISLVSRKIAKTASLLSDPRRVEALISIIQNPYISATEIPTDTQEHFSSRVKRLNVLEQHGLLTSWRVGPSRRYNAIKRDDTVKILNTLLGFSKRIPRNMRS